jgi:hypothetical protein
MYLKPAVLILRHGDGHTQIFCHRQSGLDADAVADIVAHLRYWEGGKEAMENFQEALSKAVAEKEKPENFPEEVSWLTLRKPGHVKCSLCWYFKGDALWILNGSETHSGVPATKLTLSAIVQAVRRALYLPDLRKWQNDMGIEIPEQKPKARPLAPLGEIAEANHHANGGDKETKA